MILVRVSERDRARLMGRLRDGAAAVVANVAERLQYVGEEAVGVARDTGSYRDRTGNLRSSVGYAVWLDGKRVGGSSGSGAGGEAARGVLDGLSQSAPASGLMLTVCAGMPYGKYVQGRGYTVLQQAESQAVETARSMLEGLTDDGR